MPNLRRLTPILACLLTLALAHGAPAVHGRMETLGDPPNPITVLYLWGSPYERGLAHGQLCATQVKQLTERMALGACLALHCTPEKLDAAWQQMEIGRAHV